MHIAFVIPYFYPAWEYGGPPRSAYELARALVQRGHGVKVLTTDSAGSSRVRSVETPKNGSCRVDGVEVFYYRNLSNYLAFHHRVCWPSGFFKDIRKQLADRDIVHVHELRSTLTIGAYYAARDLALPYVLSPHGGLRHLGKHGAKMVFDLFWGNKVLKNASAILAVSPLEEVEARRFHVEASRIRQLANAICVADYTQLPGRGVFKEKWNLREQRLILFLGRLHWIKGADVLIHAFRQLAPQTPGVHLIVAGPDDGHEAQLRRLVAGTGIEDRVTFTGFLDHHHKLQALADSDILVLPSRSEGFPVTLLEAMMCGVPVMLSSACTISPPVGALDGVLRFRSEDPMDLANALSRALRDDRLKDNAMNGRNFVVTEFSASVVAERAESVYEKVRFAAKR